MNPRYKNCRSLRTRQSSRYFTGRGPLDDLAVHDPLRIQPFILSAHPQIRMLPEIDGKCDHVKAIIGATLNHEYGRLI